MKLLEAIRAINIEQQGKIANKTPKTFMMHVKSREALHRLNSFLMTARMEEVSTENVRVLDDYDETLDRLLAETLSEKKEKKLNEKELQRYPIQIFQ